MPAPRLRGGRLRGHAVGGLRLGEVMAGVGVPMVGHAPDDARGLGWTPVFTGVTGGKREARRRLVG